jgi:hypothetical protein
LQHAVAVLSFGLIGISAFGQRYRSIELAVVPLRAVRATDVVLVLRFALAVDHKRVFHNLDLDILWFKAGQLSVYLQLIIFLRDLYRG